MEQDIKDKCVCGKDLLPFSSTIECEKAYCETKGCYRCFSSSIGGEHMFCKKHMIEYLNNKIETYKFKLDLYQQYLLDLC